jgi:hypothetical protein
MSTRTHSSASVPATPIEREFPVGHVDGRVPGMNAHNAVHGFLVAVTRQNERHTLLEPEQAANTQGFLHGMTEIPATVRPMAMQQYRHIQGQTKRMDVADARLAVDHSGHATIRVTGSDADLLGPSLALLARTAADQPAPAMI